MHRQRIRLAVAIGGLFFVLALSAPPARAQGCAMCYTASAQQKEKGQNAINFGILALLGPTLLLIGGVVTLVYRRRNINDGGSGS